MRLALFLFALLLFPTTSTRADMIDIHATADGYLDETNTIIDNTTSILVSHDPRIGAVEFDLSAIANATINDATLFLNVNGTSGFFSGVSYETGIYVYGGNGVMELADFDITGTPDASQSFVGSSQDNLVVSVTALLQAQIDASAAYIGFTLNQEGPGSYQRVYRSLEADTSTTGFNPTLRVDFTAGVAAVPEPTFAGLVTLTGGFGVLCRRRRKRA